MSSLSCNIVSSSSSPLSPSLTIFDVRWLFVLLLLWWLWWRDVGEGERLWLPSISVIKNEVQHRRLAFNVVDIVGGGRIIVGGKKKKLVVEAIRLSVIGRDKKCNWKNLNVYCVLFLSLSLSIISLPIGWKRQKGEKSEWLATLSFSPLSLSFLLADHLSGDSLSIANCFL